MNDTNIIHNRYIVISFIGKGKFGTVFKGKDIITGELVAIKREIKNTSYSSIKHETKMMTLLFQNKFRKLPYVYWYGNQNNFQYLVMTYYNCTLESYISTNIIPFINKLSNTELNLNNNVDNINSDSKLKLLFLQCIRILESIHKLYVLHRDIKPDNFMINQETLDIYLIDYGLSTFYLDNSGQHILNLKQTEIIGTPKFVSFNNCIGNTLSRRDDLISLGYMFIYFMFGFLPWQKTCFQKYTNIYNELNLSIENEKNKDESWENMSIKLKNCNFIIFFLNNDISLFSGCHYDKLKKIICFYMEYCYSLEFDDIPNYNILCELFQH